MACDLHIHSRYSFDGISSLDAICKAAQERDIRIIALTDHCDMTSGAEGIDSYLIGEANRQAEFLQVKEKYRDLTLLYGIEIGNPQDRPDQTKEFLAARKFDFVIGAVHFLPDGSDIYKLPYSNAGDIETMFRQYFESVEQLVELGGFDTLAHLDYPLRVLEGKMAEPTIIQYRDMVEPILKLLAARGIALELNTRGTYDWQKRAGPEDWVFRRYAALGGRYVTIGSDAHVTKWIGAGFSEAMDVLKRTGFHSYTIYENRVPRQVPIGL